MKENKLAVSIFAAFAFSVLLGTALQGNIEIAEKFRPLGTIYINLIKMVMVPLVFSSLVMGCSGIADVKKLGKMGGITVVFFLFTTALAVVIGLTLSNIFQPGAGISVGSEIYEPKGFPSVIEQVVGIFPSNILSALLHANMLQIIFAAIVLGIAIVDAAPKGGRLREVIEDVFEVTSWITKKVMVFTPIGIIGLMTPTVAANGLSVLLPLAKLIAAFYLAVAVQMGLTYTVSLKAFSAVKLKAFYKAMMPAQIIAFVSCSSAAALPVSMQRTQEQLHISKEVSGFVLPLGATVNMDGNALYQGIVALFIAQAYGIEISIPMQVTIVLTGTLASIGAAGVPGAGMIVLSTVLMSAGLPVDGIALVAGIDRILDMGRTLTNVTGDAVTACIVEKRLCVQESKSDAA